MFKRKGGVLIALVVLISIFVYYRYAVKVFPANKPEESEQQGVANKLSQGYREVSAVVTYNATEDKKDTLKFVITVNKDGLITALQTLDAETGKIAGKKIKFNNTVEMAIAGKKLSSLTAVDKVASSTLTTEAFNSVLELMKSQL